MTLAARPPRRLATLLGALAVVLTVPAAQAVPIQWTVAAGGNDHWYEYISTGSIFAPIGFDAARAAALGSAHLGQQGYLATINSGQEQAFVESSFAFLLGFGNTGTAWLGGSDAAVEGEWRWLDGPEAGQAMGYTNWLVGQPVSAPGFEDHDLLALSVNANLVGQPAQFGWSSLPLTGGAFGYIVEYGSLGSPSPVPEPSTMLMAATALLILSLQARRRRR